MRFSIVFTHLAFLLTLVSAQFSDTIKGPAPVSKNLARAAALMLRQVYVDCANGNHCVNSLCCGNINCMPATAQCCSNGQYCLAGSICVVGTQDGVYRCKDTSGSFSDAGNDAAVTTTATSTPTTAAKSSGERREGGVLGALVVAGVAALL